MRVLTHFELHLVELFRAVEVVAGSGGTAAWQLVVPDRRTYDKTVGEGPNVTLVQPSLLQHAPTKQPPMTPTDYGIRTWNRFPVRGGQWSEDLMEKL